MSQQPSLHEPALADAPVGLAVIDPEGRFISVNTELAYINGLPAEDHAGRDLADVMPGLDGPLLEAIREVARTGCELRDLEFRGEIRRRPGVVRDWLCGFYPYHDPTSGVRAVGYWVVDVTHRKQPHDRPQLPRQEQREALAALEASRMRLQLGIQAAGLVMAEIDYHANVNYISGELARLLELGDGPRAVPRQAIFDRIHPEDRERYLRAIRATVDPRGDGYLVIDVRGLMPSGALRWLHIRLQVTFAPVDGETRPNRGICAARDVTAETIAEGKLRAAQRLAESVIEGSGALVYAKDLDGRYILSNQAWRTLHRLTPEQAHGATDVEIFGTENAAHLRENDARVARTGGSIIVQERLTLEGQQVTFRSSKFPLYDEAGQVHAVCGVSTDITDVVMADRRKDAFIATLAHELRNPLAPLRTGLEILKRAGQLPAPAARMRDVMERQLNHMVRLVDDLLDVSRISRDKLELRLAPVTVEQVVDHAVETCQPAIEAAGHRLEVHLPQEPLTVRGDLTRLAQVLGNLLHNAIKYTPGGGRIAVRARREADHAVLEVTDSGAGIAPHTLPHVFDLFAQGERDRSAPQAGLGIGLWLVRKLVELHHGRIEAHSAGVGRGSTFTLRLPLDEASDRGCLTHGGGRAPDGR